MITPFVSTRRVEQRVFRRRSSDGEAEWERERARLDNEFDWFWRLLNAVVMRACDCEWLIVMGRKLHSNNFERIYLNSVYTRKKSLIKDVVRRLLVITVISTKTISYIDDVNL